MNATLSVFFTTAKYDFIELISRDLEVKIDSRCESAIRNFSHNIGTIPHRGRPTLRETMEDAPGNSTSLYDINRVGGNKRFTCNDTLE